MVEISRDGRRVYATNSLYAAWDEVFYPDGVGAWMVKFDADVSEGGLVADPHFFPHGADFAACESTRPDCRAVTRPATRIATPVEWDRALS